MLKVLPAKPEDFLYTLKSIKKNDWQVYFYKEFDSIILDENSSLNEDVWDKIKPFLNQINVNFRIQLNFRSVPFLVVFLYQEKEIRLYSPKLSQELFLLQQSEILDLNIDQVKALRTHTEIAAKLQTKNFPSTIENLIITDNLPNLLTDPKFQEVEARSQEIIKKLLEKLNEYTPTLFERVSDFGLGLTAQYSLLRIHLLKFLAILPSLDHDKSGIEVKRILLESLTRLLKDNAKSKALRKKGQERALPSVYVVSIQLIFYISLTIPSFILATLVRSSVKLMAKRFIAGESIEKADKSLRSLAETGRDVTLDQLGELVVSEKEADHYKNEVLKLIRGFSLHVKKGETNKAGINRAHVSIKVSALCSDFKPHAPEYTYNLVAPRLKEILLAAKQEQVFINIDAEHYHYRDIVFKIYKKVLLETPELKSFELTGIVVQAYLRDGYRHLLDIIELAKQRGIQMPVRLVKGAYWDAETVEGDAHSFDAPQFLNKEETDIHFRQLIVKIYESFPHLKLAIASHNFSDHAFAEALKEKIYPHIGEIEHQCLHMTYEALSTALAKMGWATRNYVPVGSLLVGMAYLVRRIMENSSQVGVLTIMRSHKKHQSLQSPYVIHSSKKLESKLLRDQSVSKLDDEFFNVPPVRLYLDEERYWVEHSMDFYKENCLGKEYNNSFEISGEWVDIYASSKPELLVGKIKFAEIVDAKLAVETIDTSYNNGKWANSKWPFRTAMLIKAADLMLARRNDLSALIVYEAGKSINEALADVDEAIDFLNFYARSEAFLQRNYTDIISRGPTLVISPWNFPLAIPCGMTASALVSGNTVILKPAEQTPLVTQLLVDILHESGVPKDVLIHLPGVGESVGDYLVKDERISTIIFTGSKAVGLHIAREAQKRIYKNNLFEKSYPVKAITEMGGKNAVIVTQNAELDETVSGILYSAFGHAGQKCSACSRVIVHNSLKDKLLDRLKQACQDLKVGESMNFETTVNPIISKEDFERLKRSAIEASVEASKVGGRVIIDRSAEILPGYCVGPVVIEVPKSLGLNKHSYAQKELFGPILHVIGFADLDEALEIYNSTDYALTGGIFSQSQDDIDYLLTKMESGNIYVNRTITGARVGIEPFGGFKLSGTGPKAGGKHYLLSLHQILDNNKSQLQKYDKTTIDEGGSTNLFIAKSSGLNSVSRKERLEKFLSAVIFNYETFFSGLNGNQKDVLKDYKKWISKNLVSFIEREHKNRFIPGQLSFNNYQLSFDHVLLVATTATPNIKTLIQIFSSISMGTGLTIVARNLHSYHLWKSIVDALYQSGFSKENILVKHISTSEYKIYLNNPDFSHIIYDGDIQELNNDVVIYFEVGVAIRHVKNILTNADNIKVNDYYHQSLNFVQVRSLAINTMRHGAPLDLEIV